MKSYLFKFVIPSEATDLHLSAYCRFLASLGMTRTEGGEIIALGAFARPTCLLALPSWFLRTQIFRTQFFRT